MTEHVCTYPLDTIKTHMQAYRSLATSGLRTSAVVEAIRADFGATGLLRGLPVVVLGVVPAHAGMFSAIEYVKARLDMTQHASGNDAQRADTTLGSALFAAKGALAGAAGSLAHDTVMTPCDVIKQRLQLGCYDSIFDCVRSITQHEGALGLFRSMPTTLAMNAPWGAIFVSCNELFKRSLKLPDGGRYEDRSRVLPWYFLTAGASGAVAALATQPLDVVKTRLQTQDCWQLQRCYKPECRVSEAEEARRVIVRYANFSSAVSVISREEGLRGFYRGTHIRMMLQIPSAAICWGTYEVCKSVLAKHFS